MCEFIFETFDLRLQYLGTVVEISSRDFLMGNLISVSICSPRCLKERTEMLKTSSLFSSFVIGSNQSL